MQLRRSHHPISLSVSRPLSVRSLTTTLTTTYRANRDCWIDFDDTDESTRTDPDLLFSATKEAIAFADTCIVCLSAAFVESEECRQYTEYMVSLGKKIVPIVLNEE